jgi:SOS-response transcriptional repressor LexA
MNYNDLIMQVNIDKIVASLKYYRERNKVTQAQLGSMIGCSASAVNHYESGKRKIDFPTLQKMCRAIGLDWMDFMTLEEGETLRNIERPHYAPLISWVHAGEFADKHDYGHIGIGEPIPYIGRDQNAFSLIIDGDSMMPEFNPGDRIVVSPNAHVDNGNYCVIEINGQACLKKVIFHNDEIQLKSLNPDYNDVFITRDEKSFRIIGKVIWKAKKY